LGKGKKNKPFNCQTKIIFTIVHNYGLKGSYNSIVFLKCYAGMYTNKLGYIYNGDAI